MSAQRVRARLQHIIDAIEAIEAFTAGKSLGDYQSDRMMRDAVERNLERLSEASRHITEDMKARHPQVAWRGVADLGNVLRHVYDAVVDHRIWQIITDDLSPLKAAILAMLQELEHRSH